MQHHRWQPTRLPRPWDSPGKNTGVGCHFLLHCIKVKSESEVIQSSPTLSDPMDCSLPGSSVHGILQARVMEWVAIAFSKKKKQKNSIVWYFRAPLPQSFHVLNVPATHPKPFVKKKKKKKYLPISSNILHTQAF